MRIRPLLIGPAERAKIAALIALAEREVVAHDEMVRLSKAPPTTELLWRNNSKTIDIPHGYRVTLTIEEHAPGVPCRHLSVSVKEAGKGPNPAAVAALMQAFGFINAIGTAPTWMEPLAKERFAINVLEPLDGDMSKLAEKQPKHEGDTATFWAKPKGNA